MTTYQSKHVAYILPCVIKTVVLTYKLALQYVFKHFVMSSFRLSQRPVPDNTQHSQETDTYAPGRIQTNNPSKQVAAYLRLRLKSHRDQQSHLYTYVSINQPGQEKKKILNTTQKHVDKKNQLDVTFCILYFSSNSCSTCFGQPCAHHQELTTA